MNQPLPHRRTRTPLGLALAIACVGLLFLAPGGVTAQSVQVEVQGGRQSQQQRPPAQAERATEAGRQSQGSQQGRQGRQGQQRTQRPAGGQQGGQAPAARPGGTGSSARPMGAVNMATSRDTVMLRLTPENELLSQDIGTTEGELFTTDLVIVNERSRPFDRMRVILDYNEVYVSPRSINDSAIAPLLAGPPKAVVDRNLGQIIYEARFREPVGEFSEPLLFINWRAVKPVLFTPIDFGRSRDGFFTALHLGDRPILGSEQDDRDGTVSIGIQILPSDPREAAQMQEEPLLYLGSEDRVGGVEVRIVPPPEPPVVGELVVLDIVLDNRRYSRLDGVSLRIQYDPEVLQVLDSDFDNWITLGPNILDGPYHEEFPFDYHIANEVNPRRGEILYRVATSNPERFLGVNGVFASIVARAKAPTRETSVSFLFSRQPRDRTTEVVYLGQDVLGDTDVVNDGTRGASFPILPAE